MIDDISQFFILFTMASIFMMGSQRAKIRMQGAVVALLGQPFWVMTAWLNGQWGVFIAALVITWFWLLAFIKNAEAWKQEQNRIN